MPEAKISFHHLLGPGVATRNFSKGKTIFQEGDRGDEFFIIVRGQVEIGAATVISRPSGRTAFSAKWR